MGTQCFGQFLEERIRESGMTIKNLSEISGISIRHLEALAHDEFSLLPPAPYIRGYMNKLGAILEFTPEEWWERIKISELKLHIIKDTPPKNKFTRRYFPKNAISIFLVTAAVIFIIGAASPKIFGKPTVAVTYPSGNPAVALEKNITIEGLVKNSSELYINGEFVEIGDGGEWKKTLVLEAGINPIEIRAKKFLGGETMLVQRIIYETPDTSLNPIPAENKI